MEEQLISVVVPIYNVEKYIKECIESIINQTYKNLQIILVDDGSEDNSSKICDEYSKKDNRINVIHKSNGGLSDARNYGIDIAKGEYITFIDSDDFVSSTYIEKLYNAIKENNVKISQCGIVKVNNKNEKLEKIGYLENEIKSGKQLIKEIYKGHWTENIVVWNKMYCIELFKCVRYPVGKIHEDEYVTYKILYEFEKIAIIKDYLYNYRQTDESIVGKKFNLKRLDILEALEERINFFKNAEEIELYDLTLRCYLQKIAENYVKTRLYIKDNKNILKELIKKYRQNYKLVLKAKKIKLFIRLRMGIFYISPTMFYIIKKSDWDKEV